MWQGAFKIYYEAGVVQRSHRDSLHTRRNDVVEILKVKCWAKMSGLTEQVNVSPESAASSLLA